MKRIKIKASAQFSAPAPLDGLFLPDLCNIRILLLVIVIAEMLAFILTLAGASSGQRWQDLGLISLFVQWVALFSVLSLCLMRPWLANFNNTLAGVISFILINVITLVLSEIAFSYIAYPGLDQSTAGHIDFLLRNLGISIIVSLLTLRYFFLQYQSSKSMLAENTSRIEALQSRIRPHFLFNSMNVIASLTRSNPKLAEQAIVNLSQIFRASLSDIKKQISLHEEISICKSYLQIETLRLGERLQVDWQIESGVEGDMIPALLLQPLIENAVIHGIEPLTEGGVILISAQHKMDKQTLELEVINPCDNLKDENKSTEKGNKIALNNIKQRLDAIYKGESSIVISQKNNQHTVTINIPINLLVGAG